MCPDPLHENDFGSRVRGFSLPLALFILVVLGLLSTVLYRTIAISNLSVAQEVLSARAFLAADSGAQAGMMQLFPVDGSPATCSASSSQTLTGSGFNNCTIVMSCSKQVVDGEDQYLLSSTATCTASSTRASRTIVVGAHNLEAIAP